MNKKLLVIFHVWYKDQVDYFIAKLANINNCEWDLWVTMSYQDDSVIEKFRNYKPDTRFITAPNVGYDIAPFVEIIRHQDISKYDYILKLHTKRYVNEDVRFNSVNVKGWVWRDLLIDALLGTKEKFLMALNKLGQDDVGMVCSYELYKYRGRLFPEDTCMLEAEAERIGIQIRSNKFCAGSIFIVKTNALKKIIEAEIDVESWGGAMSGSWGTPAHVYERLLCLVVTDAGYKIRCSCATVALSIQAFIYKSAYGLFLKLIYRPLKYIKTKYFSRNK